VLVAVAHRSSTPSAGGTRIGGGEVRAPHDRAATISVVGVYGGMTDPLPMMTLFDKQIQLRNTTAPFSRSAASWPCGQRNTPLELQPCSNAFNAKCSSAGFDQGLWWKLASDASGQGLARRRGFRSGFCRRPLTRPNRMTVSPGPRRSRFERALGHIYAVGFGRALSRARDRARSFETLARAMQRAGPPRESNANPARESVSIAASSRRGMVTGTVPAATRGYGSAGSSRPNGSYGVSRASGRRAVGSDRWPVRPSP